MPDGTGQANTGTGLSLSDNIWGVSGPSRDPSLDTLLDLDGDEWRLADQPEGILVLSWIRGEW